MDILESKEICLLHKNQKGYIWQLALVHKVNLPNREGKYSIILENTSSYYSLMSLNI